jgi:hypothetical protein
MDELKTETGVLKLFSELAQALTDSNKSDVSAALLRQGRRMVDLVQPVPNLPEGQRMVRHLGI